MNFPAEVRIDSTTDGRLGVEVTRQCNCRCTHCFAGARGKNTEEIPFETVKAIVLEGYYANYRHLHVTGGEPLLYGRIFEILDFAVELGYRSILLNTNGTLLNQSICQRLSQYPFLTLTISLEGTKTLHERFRGAGFWQKAVKGLEIGLANDLDIIVFSIASKSLLPNLPHFAENLISRFPGIKYLTLIRLIANSCDGSFGRSEYLSPEDFIDLAHTTGLINLHGLRTVLLNEPLINVVSKKSGLSWMPRSLALCREGNLMIRADLGIGLSHSNRNTLGYYEPGALGRILAGDQYKKAFAPDEQVCPTCIYRALCQDGGLFRPAEWHINRSVPAYFCQAVLDLIAA